MQATAVYNPMAKNLLLTYVLWAVFSVLGVHRFYLGKVCSGILFICTFGGFGIWWLVDAFLIPSMVMEVNMANGCIPRGGVTVVNTLVQQPNPVRPYT
ncbi:hypothetical protein KIPB_011075 [Kipferlia bialata]|uniref:TM2 domain-containing protein n=1 Tax=Kipferlia bialata TaxID=797122 RepID=A0A9K3D6U8_9EUKA|nr:hypothetical protein KIPB_011075 [Kipferlia bialata]|eukprot:g11075.t1